MPYYIYLFIYLVIYDVNAFGSTKSSPVKASGHEMRYINDALPSCGWFCGVFAVDLRWVCVLGSVLECKTTCCSHLTPSKLHRYRKSSTLTTSLLPYSTFFYPYGLLSVVIFCAKGKGKVGSEITSTHVSFCEILLLCKCKFEFWLEYYCIPASK